MARTLPQAGAPDHCPLTSSASLTILRNCHERNDEGRPGSLIRLPDALCGVMRGSTAKTFATFALLAYASFAGIAAATPPRAAVPRFSFDTVLAEARLRAASAYQRRRNDVPRWIARLNPDQYRSIEFKPAADIWLRGDSPFRLEVLPVGYRFQAAVRISTVEDGVAHDVPATPSMFDFGASVPRPPANAAIPLSGFRLRGRINSKKAWDEFLVFQGASYFRAVARGEAYGLSGRGLAIDTASPAGEEFPSFTHFWIERPTRKSGDVVIYGLLESPSTTGAYRFTVKPGTATVMDVEATLFPRKDLRNYGIAPLTSMFLFDETNRGLMDDYRPEVHLSDGLQITTDSGEHVWRPLANPAKLQISAFTTAAPLGFGLIQRSRRQSDFEDLDAHYERCPSAWIEPKSGFGAGAVELVEIPSGRETNDNIDAFFQPARTLRRGQAAHFAYRLTWLAQPQLPRGLGMVVATRSGASLDGRRRVFQIDFVGAGDRTAGMHVAVSASSGGISNVMLLSNPAMHGVRASFELAPNGADLIELRLQIMRAGRPVTETWLYRWTAR